MAAQLTATNGRPRRRPLSWIARATSSFPAPLSPRMRRGASTAAVRRMSSNSLRALRLWPMRPPRENARRSRLRRKPCASRILRASRPARTASTSCCGEKGFTRYSAAPNFIASTAESTAGNPVIRMTTMLGSTSLATRRISMPPTSGILRSVTVTSTAEVRSRVSAFRPDSARMTSQPLLRSTSAHMSRVSGSSSTTRMRSARA